MSTQTAIPVEKFGRDHWSLLGYIECRCVDNKGVPDRDHMRINPQRHPGLAGTRQARMNGGQGPKWKGEYATRLKGHSEKKSSRVPGHDDWDCADDLEAAGFIEILGTGIHPTWKMTERGLAVAAKLREHKAKGGSFSTFELH